MPVAAGPPESYTIWKTIAVVALTVILWIQFSDYVMLSGRGLSPAPFPPGPLDFMSRYNRASGYKWLFRRVYLNESWYGWWPEPEGNPRQQDHPSLRQYKNFSRWTWKVGSRWSNLGFILIKIRKTVSPMYVSDQWLTYTHRGQTVILIPRTVNLT